MANVKGNASDIDPVVPTPTQQPTQQQQGFIRPAEDVRYMPPTSEMASKGTFTLPSGNKVSNA